MKKIPLLLLGLLSGLTCVHAQETGDIPIDEAHFPDAVFRQYIAENFDKDFNNILSESERLNVQSIRFSDGRQVSSLDGITYFENLNSFEFNYQHALLVPLDLRYFSKLESISTYHSSIKQLLVSGLSNLQSLSCSENKLTELDLSGCSNLEQLYCYDNELSVLDLSDCANLYRLECSNNHLTSLDVSHTKLVEEVYIRNNFALVTVDEDRSYDLNNLPGFDISKASNWTDGTLNGSTLTFIKDTVYYNYDISHPTQLQYARLALILSTDPIPTDPIPTGYIPIDEAHFSDASFREYLSSYYTGIDLNHDGCLSAAERESVTRIVPYGNFNFINGLHHFPNLKSVSVSHIDSIDLKGCTVLTHLNISNEDDNYNYHPLHISFLSDCSQLDTLIVQGNLPDEDWQLPTSLTYLSIESASLHRFDFELPNLKFLRLYAPIATFHAQTCKNLQSLSFSPYITVTTDTLNISGLQFLNTIFLGDYIACSIKHLDCHNCPALTSITTGYNSSIDAIESINFSGCHSLKTTRLLNGAYLSCLQSINLSGCKQISNIKFSAPRLTSLDLTDCANLNTLEISAPLSTLSWPEQFNLTDIKMRSTNLPRIDLRNRISLSKFAIADDSVKSIDLSGCTKKLSSIQINAPQLTSLDLTTCDSLYKIDINAPLTELIWPKHFNLGLIYLSNTRLTSIDLHNNTKLLDFSLFNDCIIQNIDLAGCTNLGYELYDPSHGYAHDPSIEITSCPDLKHLDLSGCVNLKSLLCTYNRLKNLDLSELTSLSKLDCSDNQLEQLQLSGSYNLEYLYLDNNHLTSFDLESFWKLREVTADNNQLAFLNGPTNAWIYADDNFHPVRLNAQHAFNLNLLPGFDISKMRRLEGGVLNGKMLTFLQDTVYYEYRCSETTDGGVFFALVRDPSSAPGDLPISAENFPDARFRAYIQTHLDTDSNDSLSDEECLAATEIDVAGQQIRTLQGLHNFVYLKYLNADGNLLTSLDLSRNAALEVLSCDDNYLEVETDATFSFDLASLPDFDLSRLRFVRGGTLDGSRLTFQRDTVRFEYQTYYAGAALVPQSVPFHLVTDLPDVPEFGGLPISEANFPDETFRQYVAAQFDRNANDSLSERERAAVSEINVAGLGIGSLQGLEHFPYLEKLDCSRNHLTALDLSGNNALQTLYCYENSLFVELDDRDGFDLRSLPDFEPERAENWKGGVVSGDTLRFIAKEVSYAYRHRLAGGTGVPETVSFTLTSDKQPDEPTANEDAEATAAEALFRVHPMPFRHTLHIETTLDLKRVSLYNLQGRLCRRYSSGFDALPADGLEPGLYLLLLETADGATYRIKAVKE